MVLLIFFGVILYCLKRFGIERIDSQQSNLQFALKNSIHICLRAIINKATTAKLQSHTYKLMLATLMTLCFVVMSYYRAQMNAALNSQVDNIGINSWQDVLDSDYKMLFWAGSAVENVFKYAPKGSVLNKIYQKKIANVPKENLLQNINCSCSFYECCIIQKLISNDDYLVLDHEEGYIHLKEYPCQITKISSL